MSSDEIAPATLDAPPPPRLGGVAPRSVLTRLRVRLAETPLRVPGYVAAVRRLRHREVAIVMYHGIVETPAPVYNWCLLEAAEFERQIDFLAENYTILPLVEVLDRWRQRRALPSHTACVTFDDGFRSVGTVAFPIMERRQIPSTVFLTTDVIRSGEPAWAERLYSRFVHTARTSLHLRGVDYPLATAADRAAAYRSLAYYLKHLSTAARERCFAEVSGLLGGNGVPADPTVLPMGWDDVERLARTGLMQFGSHAHTHPILSRSSVEEQRRELELSRDILRERGLSADLFAYPNGSRADFTADTQRLLRELGYRCGLTTIPGLNRPDTDPYEVRRVQVGADTRGRIFELRLGGH